MFCHSENILFKYHDQTFLHENYFLIALKGLSIEKFEKIQFLGYLIKVSVSALNHLKNQQ